MRYNPKEPSFSLWMEFHLQPCFPWLQLDLFLEAFVFVGQVLEQGLDGLVWFGRMWVDTGCLSSIAFFEGFEDAWHNFLLLMLQM